MFLTGDEVTLVETMNDLNLDHIQFMLLSKHLLNPKFIPQDQFGAVGVTDKNLLAQKEYIFYDSQANYNNWKSEIRKNITENFNKIKRLMNPPAPKRTGSAPTAASKNPKNPPMTKDDFDKFEHQVNLVKLYLSDWSTMKYSQKDLKSHTVNYQELLF